MKKQLLLVVFALTSGLALPAAAQYCGPHHARHTEVFISGYHSCGTPIYAKRVHSGRFVRIEPLTGWELRSYLQRQQRIAAQRAYQRRLARERYVRSRSIQPGRYIQRGYSQRRCR